MQLLRACIKLQYIVVVSKLTPHIKQLCEKYDGLMALAREKRGTLDGQLLTHNLQNDLKEMDNWIHTKLDLLEQRNEETPSNLIEVQKAISAHEVESSEVDGRARKIAELQGIKTLKVISSVWRTFSVSFC